MMLATAARDAVQRAALAETRAAEKMLAGDLRHRVRNSLQLVYNMLTTESESPWDPAGARRCEEVASRVLALAEIYDHMLAARRNEAIAFDRFLETLAARLAYDFSAESARLTIDTRLDPLTVPTGRAIALGLIAHELLVEGAREDDRAGERRVALDLTVEPTTGRARLVVRGRARPEAHGGSPGGLGLDLLNRLILQIDAVGTVREDGDDTEWVVRFPVED